MADDTQKSNGLREVPASEILAKIEKGEDVDYDDVVINGDIDIYNLDLQRVPIRRSTFEIKSREHLEEAKLVQSEIKITKSIFKGELKFNNLLFNELVSFHETRFEGTVEFKGSQFDKEADFYQAKFKQAVIFEARFNDRAEFRSTEFQAGVLLESKFYKDASFVNAKFNGWTHLSSSEFYGHVHFGEASFEGIADFGANYIKGATFQNVNFNLHADFDNAQFGGDVLFSNAIFLGDAIFTFAQFKEIAYFWGASFKRKFDIRNIRFNNIRIQWEAIKDHLVCEGPEYLALVKNFNNWEQFNDADRCYYEYRKSRRSRLKGKEKFLDIIPWMTCGYGIHPEYPLIWMFALFISSSFIYLLGGQAHFPYVLYLSAVIITTTTQVGNLTGFYMAWSVFERIFGWLLMSAFLVIFVKQMLR
jgi:uncharacterized protein YjbI with pentapeptide repeats